MPGPAARMNVDEEWVDGNVWKTFFNEGWLGLLWLRLTTCFTCEEICPEVMDLVILFSCFRSLKIV